MAIQLRKGASADFDKSKMLQGECAITTDGKFYYCYTAGQVKELMSKEELVGILNTSGENYDRLMELLESEESWEEFVDAYVEELTDAYTDEVLTPAKAEIELLVQQAELLVGNAVRFVSTINFGDLPAPSDENVGNMYSVNDNFVSDNRFVDGSGKSFGAGTNVVVVESNNSYYYDALGGLANLQPITNPTFTEATTLSNVNSGESQSVLWGKVKKWYTDAISKVSGLVTKVGTATLTTTAQNLSGAVNENKTNIDALNSNLNYENEYTLSNFTPSVGGTMNITARRKGNSVNVTIKWTGTLNDGGAVLGEPQLPEDFRPTMSVYDTFVEIASGVVYGTGRIYIRDDGLIVYTAASTSARERHSSFSYTV